MSLLNKLTVPFITLIIPFLTSCNAINMFDAFISYNFINKNNFTIDVGNGKKTSATFPIKINFDNSNDKTFFTKNSSSGIAGKTKGQIQLIRFYLVDSNATTLTDSNIKEGPFDVISTSPGSLGTLFTNLTGAGTGTINFTNVKTGTYYVAVAAYSSTTTVDSTTNITNLSTTPGDYTGITISGPVDLGRFALSSTGGDFNTSGSITVGTSPNYVLTNSPTNPLVVNLKLADAVGATLESSVTITNGTTTYTGTPTLQ